MKMLGHIVPAYSLPKDTAMEAVEAAQSTAAAEAAQWPVDAQAAQAPEGRMVSRGDVSR
jgi:hypothetical protein